MAVERGGWPGLQSHSGSVGNARVRREHTAVVPNGGRVAAHPRVIQEGSPSSCAPTFLRVSDCLQVQLMLCDFQKGFHLEELCAHRSSVGFCCVSLALTGGPSAHVCPCAETRAPLQPPAGLPLKDQTQFQRGPRLPLQVTAQWGRQLAGRMPGGDLSCASRRGAPASRCFAP